MITSRSAAPFRVRRTGARVGNLHHDGLRVAGVTWLIFRTILLRANNLEAFATAQVVVTIAIQTGPKLRVVVALRGRKIAAQRNAVGILAQVRVRFAEGIAVRLKAGNCATRSTKTVETEAARTIFGKAVVSRA